MSIEASKEIITHVTSGYWEIGSESNLPNPIRHNTVQISEDSQKTKEFEENVSLKTRSCRQAS
jgi:hypothetical protein